MGLREAVQQQQGWAAVRCLAWYAGVQCGLGQRKVTALKGIKPG